jgi:hypothetical protein
VPEELTGPAPADQSEILVSEPAPIPPVEQSQLNDLPIEANISEYIPQTDDHEFGDSVIYHSDEGEEEEEEEVDDEDDDDDDEEEDDDDDEVDEDDDEDDQDPGVSYFVDEEAEMSSEGEENNESMDVADHEFVQLPIQEEHHHNEEDEDGDEDVDEDGDEGEGDEDDEENAAQHLQNVVDQFLTNAYPDDPDNDEDDFDNAEEGTADVEQEIFLSGELENPEIDTELRRIGSPPELDDEGEDDDPVGGLDSGFLVNHLEDDDDAHIE